jgi:hypothetical protein
MHLTSIHEEKIKSFWFSMSARSANKFIELLIKEASENYEKAWEAERFMAPKIREWNRSGNRFKLVCGSGGHHVYIHLETLNSIEYRLAIVSEVI